MAKTKKRATAKPVAKKRPDRPAKPTKVIVKKRDIENVLAHMENCFRMLRQAWEAYDGTTDTAVLHLQTDKRVIGPPPFCFDCFPPRDPGDRGRRS